MNKLNLIFMGSLLALASCSKEMPELKKLQPVPFTAVHINDQFWAPKIETNRTVSIPSAFHQCEINGRMDNFALAGGLIKGQHKGDFPFDDTDVYKIIEGASYTLAVQYDKKLDLYLDSVITLIAAAQEPDGYLTTCVTNKCERLRPWYGKGRWDRINSHELYNSGHLYEAAVAHFLATGKRSLLDVATKNANLIDKVFGPGEGQKKVPSGHPIVEMALVKLYRVTGEARYLKLAKFFIDETGKGTDGHKLSEYSQDHKPIADQDEAVGHAVRLGYLYSGVTDVASLLNDTTLMKASKKVWDNVVSKKLYITGGIGSRAQGEGFGGNYELNNMTAYCETCASIANGYWNYRLFLNDADSRYYDILERVLYNGVISGVSLSGNKFFYDNPLESNHTHERAPWFGCACCPGNVTRFMASIPGYVYATSNNTILVNLFVGNNAKIALKGDTVHLSQKTNYPWNGDIEIEVDDPGKSEFNLMVRIPGWVKDQAVPSDLYKFVGGKTDPVEFKINGIRTDPKILNGFAVFTKRWGKGDKIQVNFPMNVNKIIANDLVQADKGKIAYQRGPVVYCFEDKDNNQGWMFNTYIPETIQPKVEFEKDLLGGVETFTIKGFEVDSNGINQTPEPVSLKAIPYYAWNNRGAANMMVWMPKSGEYVYSKLGQGKEIQANALSSEGPASGLNDGFEPKNSADIDKPFFNWYNLYAKEFWVQYDFTKPLTLTESKVYWLNIDHYDGNYRAPKTWSLEYKTKNGKWTKVLTNNTFGIEMNKYNVVGFKPVTISSIRMNVEFQPKESCGILEWKVN